VIREIREAHDEAALRKVDTEAELERLGVTAGDPPIHTGFRGTRCGLTSAVTVRLAPMGGAGFLSGGAQVAPTMFIRRVGISRHTRTLETINRR
jgi:hypothetical protein